MPLISKFVEPALHFHQNLFNRAVSVVPVAEVQRSCLLIPEPVEDESDARRVDGIFDLADETRFEAARYADLHRHAEHIARELRRAFYERAAACQYHAGSQMPGIARAFDLHCRDFENLLHSRLDDLGQQPFIDLQRRTAADAGYGDRFVIDDACSAGKSIMA